MKPRTVLLAALFALILLLGAAIALLAEPASAQTPYGYAPRYQPYFRTYYYSEPYYYHPYYHAPLIPYPQPCQWDRW